MTNPESPDMPELEELLARMRPPATPDEAFQRANGALDEIVAWRKNYTVPLLSGLMTDIRFQTYHQRFDWLQRLVLSKATGRKKPKKADLESIINAGFKASDIWRLEDPIEDAFVDAVPTSRGDLLIFDGHWGHAASYTHTLIRAFESLPDGAMKRDALEAAYALLTLSNALVERAGIERRAFVQDAPWTDITLPSTDSLKRLADRVRFSAQHIAQLGIRREALEPFILLPEHHQFASDRTAGDTPLEFHPLLAADNGVVVAHPGTISLAARAVLLNAAKQGGMADALTDALQDEQREFSSSSGFWPGGDLFLAPWGKHHLREAVCEFAPGRFLHVVQIPTPLDQFPRCAFGQLVHMSADVRGEISRSIASFWEFLGGRADHRESATVLLLCGWGAGHVVDLDIKREDAPPGWRLLPLTYSDTATLGACEDGKLRNLWRMMQQKETLEGVGYAIVNNNGTLNLFGHWRQTSGNFIPEHEVDLDPPCQILLHIDELLEPRLEGARKRDLRSVPFVDGRYKLVQRVEWGPDDELRPIYGSLDDIKSASLIGVVAVRGRAWWIEAVQGAKKIAHEWQYQMWNAVLQWLGAAAERLIEDVGDELPEGAFAIRLVIEDEAGGVYDGRAPDGSVSDYIEVTIDERTRSASVRIKAGWGTFVRSPQHHAEFALIEAVLNALAACGGRTPNAPRLTAALRAAIPSTDWRWLHAEKATMPARRLAASGLIEVFREIPMSASALVRCGMVWRFHDRGKGHEFNGEEACRDFLQAYYDFVCDDLIARIRQFDRKLLVSACMRRYNASRHEHDRWRTSIRALSSIRGSKADEAALDRQNAINAVQRAAKSVCEIAACEAPMGGGAKPGRDDLDEMFARALLLFGNGQLYASIRAGLLKPNLKVSPAGDLLSDRTIFEQTFIPASMRAHERTLDEASTAYLRRAIAVKDEPVAEKLSWDDGLREAVEAEYGCSAEAFVDLQYGLMELAEDDSTDILLLRRSELAERITAIDAYPDRDISSLITRLTLPRQPNWTDVPADYTARDRDLSRFDRTFSLINRPLLTITDDDDPLLAVSPIMVSDAIMYAIGGLHDGNLHDQFWSSREARAYAGKRADERGREFEDRITGMLQGNGIQAWSRRTVPSIVGKSVDRDLGDVDILAVSPDGTTLWVLEAKNLRLCRTEIEAAARLTDYGGQMRADSKGKERPDKLLRHITRVQFVRAKAERAATTLGLTATPDVRGLVVVDAPQPMNFRTLEGLQDAEFCMLGELLALVAKGREAVAA